MTLLTRHPISSRHFESIGPILYMKLSHQSYKAFIFLNWLVCSNNQEWVSDMHQCGTMFVQGLAKNSKVMSVFVLFSWLFCPFSKFGVFPKMVGQTSHESIEGDSLFHADEQPELNLKNDYPNKTGHNLNTNSSILIL